MSRYLILLLLCFATIAGHAQPDAIYNFDLEQINGETGLPLGWGLGNIQNASIPEGSMREAYKADASVVQHGKYSLLADWTNPYKEWTATNYVINKTFDGQRIKLTGYMKLENVAEWAGLWMRIDGDKRVLAFDNMQSQGLKGTSDWKEYTIELNYDKEEAKSIVIGSVIAGTGKVWIDNLHLTIDGKDISVAPAFVSGSKADHDTAYALGSGIVQADTPLSNNNIKALTNLGMLWGFIKYYHARVNNGDYNMDAELFRVLPKVLAAGDMREANHIMDKWVDIFGKPDLCKACADFKKTASTKLAPDYGYLFDKNYFPQSLIDKLSYIKKNRSQKKVHYYIGMEENVGNPKFKHENGYADNAYPDAGLRLLALYRFWNMVQYFFPDKHLIGEDWNKVLAEFIPEFYNAKDAKEYQVACLKLIARIHDTHASIWAGGSELFEMMGDMMPPFQAEFIEGKLVVVDYYQDTLDVKYLVKPGNVIEMIDGVRVDDLVKKYLPLTTGSNYETQLRNMAGLYGFLFRGSKPEIQLTISRDGKFSEVTVPRIPVQEIRHNNTLFGVADTAYKLIQGNIGYIYPGMLADGDIDSVKTLFAKTKGVIIDMRCYPSSFMPFTYGRWLKPSASPFVKFTLGSIDIPGQFETGDKLSNGSDNKNYYKGKVVIIVDATTQSQAEYTTMALRTAPACTVIGSTTAGADGNVSEIVLPGGIKTMISGIGVLYPDGTETQRKGVKIDKVVKPTIKGIEAGRDEQLEEAIKIIKG